MSETISLSSIIDQYFNFFYLKKKTKFYVVDWTWLILISILSYVCNYLQTSLLTQNGKYTQPKRMKNSH